LGGKQTLVSAIDNGAMAEDWTNIAERLERLRTVTPEGQEALGGIAALARHISKGPLASVLFGWTSMSDLCIQQTDVAPYSGPFLRVSPQAVGTVEFRYVDTGKAERQWHRAVPADAAVERLSVFLEQLHWTAL
jgi:hypothetical protein